MDVSLCYMVKDQLHALSKTFYPTYYNIVPTEVIFVDTGSTDGTLEWMNSLQLAVPKKVYQIPFDGDFGSMRTKLIKLATRPWILTLDADESLPSTAINHLYHTPHQAIAIPRYRFSKFIAGPLEFNEDLLINDEVDDPYPDYQVRLIRNNPTFCYKRSVHEYFHGAAVHHLEAKVGEPHIYHFKDVFNTAEQKNKKLQLYTSLALKEGINPVGGKPL